MASLSRRISSVLLAAALIGSLAEPALAQVSPGMPTVGPSGGTSSTTAPSNNEGTPAGGTGNIGNTRVGPGAGGLNDGRIVLNPQQNAEPAPVARRQQARQQRRVVRRQQARRANQAAARGRLPNTSQGTSTGIGAGSAAGLNNSNAPSR